MDRPWPHPGDPMETRAYHVAGHAVVAAMLGAEVPPAVLDTDPAAQLYDLVDPPPTDPAINAAGQVAEVIAGVRKKVNWRYRIPEAARMAALTPALQKRAEWRAETFLRRRWRVVEAIARELLDTLLVDADGDGPAVVMPERVAELLAARDVEDAAAESTPSPNPEAAE